MNKNSSETKNKRLKILFLPSWYPSKSEPVEGIFIKEHAKAASLFNDVIVIYADKYDKSTRSIFQEISDRVISDKIEDGVRTILVRHFRSRFPRITYPIYLWTIWQTLRRLNQEGWKPDIIHAHVFAAGIPAVILGRIYRIPVLISEHFTAFPLRLLRRELKIAARFAMNRANLILPVSKYLEEAIKSYGIKNKFRIVPNAVNTDTFYYVSSGVRVATIKKKILFVGLLTCQKGIPYLLEALKRLTNKRQDFILDVVGNGPNKKEYKELAESLGLGSVVKFHGLRPKEETAEFMRKSNFCVFPSLWETFSVVCIEAMACGKPVIATNLPVFKEKVNKDRGILVPPKNEVALEEAINYMLDHYRDYVPERISQYAREKFDYEAIGKILTQIYKETIKEFSKPR